MTAEFTNMFRAQVSLMQIVSNEWERVYGEIVKSKRESAQKRKYLRWTHADGLMLFDDETGLWLRGDAIDDEEFKEQQQSNPLQLLQWYVGGEMTSKTTGYLYPSILHLEDFHPYLEATQH